MCVGQRRGGVSWENKCDESMWIIVCVLEGTNGHNCRGLVLQSKVMCVRIVLKSILVLSVIFQVTAFSIMG